MNFWFRFWTNKVSAVKIVDKMTNQISIIGSVCPFVVVVVVTNWLIEFVVVVVEIEN